MGSTDRRPRVLLVGYGPTTRSALAGLLAEFEVVGLIRNVIDETVRDAQAAGVPVHDAMGPRDLTALVDGLSPDCVVVSSYDRILGGDLLGRCPFVNVHYAPLPRGRGRANVNWAILNGDDDTAVTVHTMVPGVDAGGILAQQRVTIGARDTVGDLYARLNDCQAALLPKAVRRRLSGDLGDPQDEADATYGCTRIPEDGEIDWADSTEQIDRLVRALAAPYPGAFTYLGLRRLTIVSAEPVASPPRYTGRVPGRVIGWSADEGWVDVLTGDGVLRVRRVRTEDGQQPAVALVKGSRTTLGLQTRDLLARIAALTDSSAVALRDSPA